MRLPRLRSTVAVLAALGVGHVITTHLDVNSEQLHPFYESGRVGHEVHLSYADVEVTDVRPAMYVSPRSSDELARKAGGVFVLVSVTATADREPISFQAAFLVDDEGRMYRKSEKAGCAINTDTGTGVPTYAVYCFDVPASRLAGMRFQISRGNLIYSTLAGDDVADVDLGIDAAEEAAWARTEDAYGAADTDHEPIVLETVDLQQAPS